MTTQSLGVVWPLVGVAAGQASGAVGVPVTFCALTGTVPNPRMGRVNASTAAASMIRIWLPARVSRKHPNRHSLIITPPLRSQATEAIGRLTTTPIEPSGRLTLDERAGGFEHLFRTHRGVRSGGERDLAVDQIQVRVVARLDAVHRQRRR